jgi:methylmalonyl-CoA/ethylmalonyl-CoA epimerase
MITHIEHIGIACRDLDEAIEFYRASYGFELCHTEVIESQGVREAMLRVGSGANGTPSYVQLLEPVRDDCAIATWLARNGPGIHHIAFGTDDVDMTAAGLKERGIQPLFDPPGVGGRGTRVTFLHPRDCHGVLTELVTLPTARAAEPGTGTSPQPGGRQ